ncbi:TIGR03752 family integrating conjugative element protein [Endozoicomonas sp. ALC066]|uniref:TIGR03752 family integrating conjugative element protein n=1 Tax=Endozoicomonas sp. ALC066 TaxID=3403078 RepID=UPI003BB56ECB
MQSNGFLKILVGAIGLTVVFLGINKMKGSDEPLQKADPGPVSNNNLDSTVSEEQLEILGIESDSTDETLRTLVAQMVQYDKKYKALEEENAEIKKHLSDITGMEERLTKKLTPKIPQNQEPAPKPEEPESWLDQMKHRVDGVKDNYTINGSTFTPGNDVPEGIGIDLAETDVPAAGTGNEVVWIDPLDAQKVEDKRKGRDGFSLVFPESTDTSAESKSGALDLTVPASLTGSSTTESTKPFFTIPENSTLIGSVSMSAMLGRIPINGTVTDPYPIKIMVGPENLATNGLSIPPNVSGIVMSGVAKGDWTLSCVSADITSMTFTFNDGTIRTISEDGGNPIAWISDKYGIPCVTGERITNAASYLSAQIGLGALDAYAQARADAETTTTFSGTDGVKTVDGDPTDYATASLISGGSTEVLNWVEERMQQSFDAVYVPPGVEVIIHPSQQLEIDYDQNGRKVNHHANQISSGVRSSLD